MNSRIPRALFLAAGLFAFAETPVLAADAVFSGDGQHVYLIEFDKPTLAAIDLADQSASKLDLGAFTGHQPILAVSFSAAGKLLFVTAHNAWAYSFEKMACVKLCSAGADAEFDDLAYDPKSGAILFSLRKGGSLYLKRDAAKPLPVFMRRVNSFEGIAFSPDGELFFGARGDLWMGRVEIDEEDPQNPRAVLSGTRCAPLATLETYIGTPSQIGVQKVAVAGEKLYAHLHRMGGSGWGNIVRLNKPASGGEDGLAERLQLYAKEASSVEILAENGSASYLCASPDGKRVFFTTGVLGHDDVTSYLVEENATPRALSVKFSK